MIRRLVQATNFLLGRTINKSHIHFVNSLNWLQRTRAVDKNYLDYIRLSTLELISAEINEAGIAGAVAELGVYKGKFARYINQYFPGRKLYLFDTFAGFDLKDVKTELDKTFSGGAQDFSDTSVEAVLKRMPYPDLCVVRKGFFPETAEGLDEQFALVSLDADLYDPIYAGLKYFYPRLNRGGYIMIHDYNNDHYKGAREAVRKFCSELKISFTPIPDSGGTAIIAK